MCVRAYVCSSTYVKDGDRQRPFDPEPVNGSLKSDQAIKWM